MAEAQKPNKPLFSRHYLEHRLPECPEWREDGGAVLAALQDLFSRKKALLPTLNEAQTETEFIQPALELLGFSLIPQVTIRWRGRAERPDYALFTNPETRDEAYPLQGEESAFYPRVSAIAEAKYCTTYSPT